MFIVFFTYYSNGSYLLDCSARPSFFVGRKGGAWGVGLAGCGLCHYTTKQKLILFYLCNHAESHNSNIDRIVA